MRARLRATVAGLAMAGTALTVVTTPDAARAGEAAGISWKACADVAGVECGTLTVPVDWSDRDGPETTLALARRKASDPTARLGSVLYDPGGPGGSGVDDIKWDKTFSEELARHYDIVGFDPRGVGASGAVRCATDVLVEEVPAVPADAAQFEAVTAHNRRLGDSCRELTGPLIDHVDTVAIARDMDAIRAALGESRLNYYGVSYGTLMGQMYAELFPKRVGRMVLDSNMDHSQATTRQFLLSEVAAAEDGFREFVAWCDRTATCRLHGQDVAATYDDVYARAEREGLRIKIAEEIVVPLKGFDLSGLTLSAFYGPHWGQLADLLLDLRDDGYADLSVIPPEPSTATSALASALRRSSAPGAAPSATAFGDSVALPDPVFCEDWRLPVSDFRDLTGYLRAMEQAAPHMRNPGTAFSFTMLCQRMPVPVNNPQHPLRVRGAAPILLVNSAHDPVTPLAWATAAHRQISRSVLLTYQGWGHGVYWKSPCVATAADRYLVTGALPAETSCPAVEPPTDPPANQSTNPPAGSANGTSAGAAARSGTIPTGPRQPVARTVPAPRWR